MLKISPPMSNAQRQRAFCERNPGYYRRYSAKRRAQEKAARANFSALSRALQAKREPLMLPAPAVTIEIPGRTTIPAFGEIRDRSPVPATQEAAIPSTAATMSDVR